MTVLNTNLPITIIPASGGSDFTFNFRAYTIIPSPGGISDVKSVNVFIIDDNLAVKPVLQVQKTDFVIQNLQRESGVVHFLNKTIPAGKSVVIMSDLEYAQTSSFAPNSPADATKTELTDDKTVTLIKQLRYEVVHKLGFEYPFAHAELKTFIKLPISVDSPLIWQQDPDPNRSGIYYLTNANFTIKDFKDDVAKVIASVAIVEQAERDAKQAAVDASTSAASALQNATNVAKVLTDIQLLLTTKTVEFNDLLNQVKASATQVDLDKKQVAADKVKVGADLATVERIVAALPNPSNQIENLSIVTDGNDGYILKSFEPLPDSKDAANIGKTIVITSNGKYEVKPFAELPDPIFNKGTTPVATTTGYMAKPYHELPDEKLLANQGKSLLISNDKYVTTQHINFPNINNVPDGTIATKETDSSGNPYILLSSYSGGMTNQIQTVSPVNEGGVTQEQVNTRLKFRLDNVLPESRMFPWGIDHTIQYFGVDNIGLLRSFIDQTVLMPTDSADVEMKKIGNKIFYTTGSNYDLPMDGTKSITGTVRHLIDVNQSLMIGMYVDVATPDTTILSGNSFSIFKNSTNIVLSISGHEYNMPLKLNAWAFYAISIVGDKVSAFVGTIPSGQTVVADIAQQTVAVPVPQLLKLNAENNLRVISLLFKDLPFSHANFEEFLHYMFLILPAHGTPPPPGPLIPDPTSAPSGSAGITDGQKFILRPVMSTVRGMPSGVTFDFSINATTPELTDYLLPQIRYDTSAKKLTLEDRKSTHLINLPDDWTYDLKIDATNVDDIAYFTPAYKIDKVNKKVTIIRGGGDDMPGPKKFSEPVVQTDLKADVPVLLISANENTIVRTIFNNADDDIYVGSSAADLAVTDKIKKGIIIKSNKSIEIKQNRDLWVVAGLVDVVGDVQCVDTILEV